MPLHKQQHSARASATAQAGSSNRARTQTSSTAGSHPSSHSGSAAGSQAGSRLQHDSEHNRQQGEEEETEEGDDEDRDSSDAGTKPDNRQGTQQQRAKQPDPAATCSSGEQQQQLGTPGPGAYKIPSCFKSSEHAMNASAYVLASHIGASIKGRNFAPGSSPLAAGVSPGPQAYTPQEEAASVKPRAARTAFGSARRAQQEKLYLGCEQLNKAAGTSAIGPGPAAYRVGACGRSPGRQAPGPPAAPRATFAPPRSAQQQQQQRQLRGSMRSLSFDGGDSLTPEQHAHILGFGSFLRSGSSSCCSSPRREGAAAGSGGSAGSTWGSCSSSSSKGSKDDNEASAGNCGMNSSSATASYDAAGAACGSAWSFGPPNPAKGRQRRRSQEGNVFISRQHAAADPGRLVAASIPGPRYDVAGKLQLLSTHKSDGSAGFGSKSTAKLYLSPEHVKSDPALSCSPGPGTATSSLPGCMASPLGRASTAPRFGSPPRSPHARGPFISKQHEADHAGLDSPGPACYDAAAAAAALAGSVLGDRRTAHFGSGEREVAAKVKRSFAPGPGAYAGELTKLSTHASSPAFSLGASLPGSSMLGPATAAHQAPGVGAYSIALADSQCLPHSGAPTIKGKLQQGGIAARNCSPGPAAYSPRDGVGAEADDAWQQRWGSSRRSNRQRSSDTAEQNAYQQHQQQQRQESPQQGNLNASVNYSREVGAASPRSSSSSRTTINRVDTARNTANGRDLPAAAVEPSSSGSPRLSPRRGFSILGKDTNPASCGIHRDSPGPAAYQVDERLTVRYGGSCKLNSRAAPERLYISKLHAESQAGLDSPGPAAYGDTSDAQHSSISRNPSPSKRPPTSGFSFGCGARPEIAKIRF